DRRHPAALRGDEDRLALDSAPAHGRRHLLCAHADAGGPGAALLPARVRHDRERRDLARHRLPALLLGAHPGDRQARRHLRQEATARDLARGLRGRGAGRSPGLEPRVADRLSHPPGRRRRRLPALLWDHPRRVPAGEGRARHRHRLLGLRGRRRRRARDQRDHPRVPRLALALPHRGDSRAPGRGGDRPPRAGVADADADEARLRRSVRALAGARDAAARDQPGQRLGLVLGRGHRPARGQWAPVRSVGRRRAARARAHGRPGDARPPQDGGYQRDHIPRRLRHVLDLHLATELRADAGRAVGRPRRAGGLRLRGVADRVRPVLRAVLGGHALRRTDRGLARIAVRSGAAAAHRARRGGLRPRPVRARPRPAVAHLPVDGSARRGNRLLPGRGGQARRRQRSLARDRRRLGHQHHNAHGRRCPRCAGRRDDHLGQRDPRDERAGRDGLHGRLQHRNDRGPRGASADAPAHPRGPPRTHGGRPGARGRDL
ncbi:MAG: hypothetical protein AVDCRST_MAG45-2244, partial [uncultured Solirubrobacterales bacterium]